MTSADPAPPDRPREGWTVFLAAFALLCAFAGVRELWDADEGRYATVALDMLRAGDLVTPREHGLRFVDKPPLVYWVGAAAFSVLGPTPFAARLPCLLAGALLALAAYRFARRGPHGRAAGWCAAMVVATSLGGVGFSRTVTMDMPLAAAVAFAVYAGHRALEDDRLRWRLLLGACVGLGLLAKGPLGAVLPGIVALAGIFAGAPVGRTLRLLGSPTSIATALLVAGPWYVAMEHANPGYLHHFLVYEHWGRLSKRGNRDFAPFWLYVPSLAAFLLPWLPALFLRRERPTADASSSLAPAERLGLVWTLPLLLFFSAGRNRLFTYALPAFLPLTVLVGTRIAARIGDGARLRPVGLALAAQGVLALAAAVGLATGLPFDAGWPGFRDTRLVAIGLPAALGAIPLVLVPFLLPLLRTPARRGALLFGAAAAFFVGVDLGCARADAVRSPRALARTLAEVARPEDPIVCLDVVPQGLRFHEDLRIRIAGKQREIVEPWASKDGAGRLLSRDELDALWDSPARVLLVARDEKARPFVARGGRVLAERLAGGQRSDLVVVESRAR